MNQKTQPNKEKKTTCDLHPQEVVLYLVLGTGILFLSLAKPRHKIRAVSSFRASSTKMST